MLRSSCKKGIVKRTHQRVACAFARCRAMMQRGSFMQCVAIAFLLVTLRSINAVGSPGPVHYVLCS
eukprot:IDg14216t1